MPGSLLACLLAFLAVPQAAADDAHRAACDQAAAHLSAARFKEALGVLEPVLKDPALARSASRDRVNYYAGCAAFALENDFLAGRVLSRLVPFEHPLYGAHARYLLGRIHHRAGELAEAMVHYEAVPAASEKQLAAARHALQNPQAVKDPAEKARLEAIVKAPPDFAAEAVFYLGIALYEQKDLPEALNRFALHLQKEKRPEWLDEGRLRLGMCQARLAQMAEAVKTLQPIHDHARLARAARWWTARAILTAPGGKAADAVEHLKKAAGAPEVDAAPPTPEILMALGDALERAARPAEAVEVYKPLAAAGAHAEEALARLTGAHATALQFREAEDAAVKFEKQYPASPFLADVLLRRADARFAEAQGAKEAGAKLFPEAIKLYERVAAGFAGAPAHAARYRMAVAQYRLGRFAEALAGLRAIPEQDRNGELAGAFALHAECILRSAPRVEDAADAIAAAVLLKDLQDAAAQIRKALPYAGAQAPDFLMKLGSVLQETTHLLAEPQERLQTAHAARELYENFRAQFPNHPLRPVAEYERANCFALAGDAPAAILKLERFKAEPLANAPVAPLALLRQGQLYLKASQAAHAAAVLADARARHEAALVKDPARSAWVPALRYHHAAALREARRSPEAVGILESVLKEFAAGEWAEPARRLLKEIGR